jgi:hypothetical protein
VPDAADAHQISFESEERAVVGKPEPEPARHVGVERDHIAGAVRAKRRIPSNRRMAVGWSMARTAPGINEPQDAVGQH